MSQSSHGDHVRFTSKAYRIERLAISPEVRVLALNHTSTLGGAERSFLTQLEAAHGRDSVSVVLAAPEGRLLTEAATLGLPTVEIPGFEFGMNVSLREGLAGAGQMARASLAVRRAARSQDANLIHANSSRAALLAGLSKVAGGPPVVTHLRDCLPPTRKGDAIRRAISALSRTVVANSDYTAMNFVAGRSVDKPVVVYNPLGSQFMSAPGDAAIADFATEHGLSPSERAIGVVGQITDWKQQALAVEAFALSRAKFPDLKLLICGSAKFANPGARFDSGDYERSLIARVEELGLTGSVIFTGELEDVRPAMCRLDAVLMPSIEEPFGRVAIESMAMGTPVIATSVGGPPEFIEDGRTGILLPPHSPANWSDAVNRLVGDPSGNAEIGQAARAAVIERFAAGSAETSVLAAYRTASSTNF